MNWEAIWNATWTAMTWEVWLGIGLFIGLAAFLLASLPFLRFIIPIFEEMPLLGTQGKPSDRSGEPLSFETTDGLTLRGSLRFPSDEDSGCCGDETSDSDSDSDTDLLGGSGLLSGSKGNSGGLTVAEPPAQLRTADPARASGAPVRTDESRVPRGVVLFFPELDASHHIATRYAEALLKAGFVLFSFNVRSQGESDDQEGYRAKHWITQSELEDVDAAWTLLKSREDLADLPIFTFGVSRGGGLALLCAAQHPEVRGVIADSSFTADTMMLHYTRHWGRLYAPEWLLRIVPDWHLKMTLRLARWGSRLKTGYRYVVPENWFGKLAQRKTPVLLISGKKDTYVKPVIAQRIQEQVGESCEVWVVPGAKHNMARMTVPDEYDEKITSFIDGQLVPEGVSRG